MQKKFYGKENHTFQFVILSKSYNIKGIVRECLSLSSIARQKLMQMNPLENPIDSIIIIH